MISRAISILCAMLVMTACISSKAYVDPKYATLDYSSVAVAPQNATVAATFLRDGKPIKRAQRTLQASVEEVLTKAGYTIVEEGSDANFEVTFNNIPEQGAFGKGFGTGLTLGLAGTAVSDFYEILIVRTQSGEAVTREYGHAIHTTVGNAAVPVANVTPSANLNDAFGDIVEDVLLQFLVDMAAGTEPAAGDDVALLMIYRQPNG